MASEESYMKIKEPSESYRIKAAEYQTAFSID